jgi:hypothetical protein
MIRVLHAGPIEKIDDFGFVLPKLMFALVVRFNYYNFARGPLGEIILTLSM